MKHYREKLKIDTIITAVTAAILAAAFILSLLNEFGPTQFFTPAAGDSHWHSRWNGFICGASVGPPIDRKPLSARTAVFCLPVGQEYGFCF